MKRFLLTFGLLTVFVTPSQSAEWRQFRGNQTNGLSSEKVSPTSLDDANISFKIDLEGRGASGPIVIGDRVYLTSSSGFRQNRLHVHCFDAKTGNEVWERQLWATGRTMTHPKMSVATPTPASDGQRVFAFYSSNDLACFDLDGNLLWYRGLGRDFPNASNSLGMSSSPVVVGDTIVVQVESDAESFATGLDVKTGLSRWKIDRPRKANWTSPAVLPGKDGQNALVLLQSSAGLTAVEPSTGDIVWNFEKGASTIPSSTVADGKIYTPSNGITVLKPNAEGSDVETVYNSGQLSPSTPSPVVFKGQLFTINRSGVLACADAATGKRLWQLRVKGPFSSTPVAANGYLYLFNEKGKAYIIQPGEKSGEIVAERDLDGTILCSPAFADGAVYIRSDKHLWKIK